MFFESDSKANVSDRVIMLHEGIIQFDGLTKDFLNSKDQVVVAFLKGDSTFNQREGT